MRELEAELNNVRQQYLAEKEQVQSATKKLEKENRSLKRQQERRGPGALSEGNYVESEPNLVEQDQQDEEDEEEPFEVRPKPYGCDMHESRAVVPFSCRTRVFMLCHHSGVTR